MIHTFPYSEFSSILIPDEQISGLYHLTDASSSLDEKDLINKALENPINSKRLKDSVTPDMRIAVAVDDNSRSTKTEIMLPLVLDELKRGGIPNNNISIYIALGTHRMMTNAEIAEKYTPQIASNYRIVNPDWKDTSQYVVIGKSKHGFTIKIHREIVNADYVIGVGQTIPHMIAGFGGGGKIINPGCADNETIGEMHWMCSRVPEGELLAVRENAVREVIDEMAEKANLRFIINEVPSGKGIAGVFAGDPIEAHKKACALSKKVFEVKLREKTDIVIADSYPADLDFWQAIKGLNASFGAVKQGGTVILVSPCHEGTSDQHPELTQVGYIPTSKTQELVEKGELDKGIAANLFLGRKLLEWADAFLVTKGISKGDTESMGFHWARDPQEALDIVLKKYGKQSMINVLYKASKMVCIV
jgi:nickel-dependent lactate racemase